MESISGIDCHVPTSDPSWLNLARDVPVHSAGLLNLNPRSTFGVPSAVSPRPHRPMPTYTVTDSPRTAGYVHAAATMQSRLAAIELARLLTLAAQQRQYYERFQQHQQQQRDVLHCDFRESTGDNEQSSLTTEMPSLQPLNDEEENHSRSPARDPGRPTYLE